MSFYKYTSYFKHKTATTICFVKTKMQKHFTYQESTEVDPYMEAEKEQSWDANNYSDSQKQLVLDQAKYLGIDLQHER